jgi:hypothetical protein
MKSVSKLSAVAMLAMVGAFSGVAEAKDWIDKVQISRDGIDVIPIEVSASGNSYKSIKTKKHRFLMKLYAKATSGERIVAGRVGSYKGVRVFEGATPGKFDQVLDGREMGGGEARTVSRPYDVDVSLSAVTWSKNPVEVCNDMLADKKTKGYSVAEVLGKTWDAKTYVYFEFEAVAARAGKAKNDKWNIKNTAGQRHSISYSVDVKCLPAP